MPTTRVASVGACPCRTRASFASPSIGRRTGHSGPCSGASVQPYGTGRTSSPRSYGTVFVRYYPPAAGVGGGPAGGDLKGVYKSAPNTFMVSKTMRGGKGLTLFVHRGMPSTALVARRDCRSLREHV